MRQKKQEEDRTRKEAELEKKRKREERQREKEILKKTEQERIRQEELVRERAEQELRMKEAQAARVPDSFGTYRRAGLWQQAYDTSDDANIYLEPSHQQPSGFADFSGECHIGVVAFSLLNFRRLSRALLPNCGITIAFSVTRHHLISIFLGSTTYSARVLIHSIKIDLNSRDSCLLDIINVLKFVCCS